jgi:hypothetical protein
MELMLRIANMNNIPRFLFNKEIITNINSLINIGYKSYSNLIDFDKEKIISQIINILGNDAYNLIIDSENFDKTLNYFKDFLLSESANDAFKLAKTMRKNAIEYYEDNLNDLFEYLSYNEMREVS